MGTIFYPSFCFLEEGGDLVDAGEQGFINGLFFQLSKVRFYAVHGDGAACIPQGSEPRSDSCRVMSMLPNPPRFNACGLGLGKTQSQSQFY